jgi:Golgi phosphoprotein 3 (GPP34)
VPGRRANLAEDLQLCAIPESGVITSPKVPTGIGGAIAAELVLAERTRLEEDGVVLLDSTPTGDELLDSALSGLDDPRASHTRATWFIVNLGVQLSPKVHERVVAHGLVTLEKGDRRRQWFDKPDWYRLTPAGEEPRRRLRALLLGEREPDARDAVLAGLAWACDLVKIHVAPEQRKAATERAQTLTDDAAIPGHVKEAIKGAQSATATATLGAQSPIHTS